MKKPIQEKTGKLKVLIFYHYFHPDNVVSALHLSELAEELQLRHWQVAAVPCNRGCRDESEKFRGYESWKGIEIRRIWRPCFRQSSPIGRILNAMWMICAWSAAALRKKTFPDVDVLVIGTDPILSVVAAIAWKLIRPRTCVVHWCFDLYPEAAIADGLLQPEALSVRAVRRLLKLAYGCCDLIVDIGPCMRTRLRSYCRSVNEITLTPWALAEPRDRLPVDVFEREVVFGKCKLAILYSGNFGRAHSFDTLLKLARLLRGENVKFAFSIRGNEAKQVKKAISGEDKNIIFVPFAPKERLQARLSAADVHVASLKSEWTGAVVPSKFFGSLAVGRPVIFEGSSEAAVGKWIRDYRVGWVLSTKTLDLIAQQLARLANTAEELKVLQQRCHHVYWETFSKKEIADRWDMKLRELIRHN